MEIAIAESDDIPNLCALLQFLFAQEVEFEADDELQAQGLASIINDPRVGNIIVAREANDIIGMVNLLYTVSTALGGRVAILEDMVVNPAVRSKGVGSELLLYSVELAKQKGCQRITLLTDFDNENAHRFYQKHGFARSSMAVFRKPLN